MKLKIEPLVALCDQKIDIYISGLPANQRIDDFALGKKRAI